MEGFILIIIAIGLATITAIDDWKTFKKRLDDEEYLREMKKLIKEREA